MQRFRDGLVFKAHSLCVSLNSRLESNQEAEEVEGRRSSAASFEAGSYSRLIDLRIPELEAQGPSRIGPVSRIIKNKKLCEIDCLGAGWWRHSAAFPGFPTGVPRS